MQEAQKRQRISEPEEGRGIQTVRDKIWQIWQSAVKPSVVTWLHQVIESDIESYFAEHGRNTFFASRTTVSSSIQRQRIASEMYKKAENNPQIVHENIFSILLIAYHFQVNIDQSIKQFLQDLISALAQQHTSYRVKDILSTNDWKKEYQHLIQPQLRTKYREMVKCVQKEYVQYIAFQRSFFEQAFSIMGRRALMRGARDHNSESLEATLNNLRWCDLTNHRYWTNEAQRHFDERRIVWPWLGITPKTQRNNWLSNNFPKIAQEAYDSYDAAISTRRDILEIITDHMRTGVVEQTMAILTANYWLFLSSMTTKMIQTLHGCIEAAPKKNTFAYSWNDKTLLLVDNLVWTILSRTCESVDTTVYTIISNWIQQLQEFDADAVYIAEKIRSAFRSTNVLKRPNLVTTDTNDVDDWTIDDMIEMTFEETPAPRRHNVPAAATANEDRQPMTYSDFIKPQLLTDTELFQGIVPTHKRAVLSVIDMKCVDYENTQLDIIITDLEFIKECIDYLLNIAEDHEQKQWLQTSKTYVLRSMQWALRHQADLDPVTTENIKEAERVCRYAIFDRLAYRALTLISNPLACFYDASSVSQIGLGNVREWRKFEIKSLSDTENEWTDTHWKYTRQNPFDSLFISFQNAKQDMSEITNICPSVKEETEKLERMVSSDYIRKIVNGYLSSDEKCNVTADTTAIFDPIHRFLADFQSSSSKVFHHLSQRQWDGGGIPCPAPLPQRASLCDALSWVLRCGAHIVWTSVWIPDHTKRNANS